MQLELGSELLGPAPHETPHLTPHLTPPPSWSQAAHPMAFSQGSGSDPESGHIPLSDELRLKPLAHILGRMSGRERLLCYESKASLLRVRDPSKRG
jgi:hypothetical protein